MNKTKKYLYTGLTALGLIVTIGIGSAYARDTMIRNNSIDQAEAKNFALMDAGVSESDVTYTDIEFDREFGIYVYDIDFIANGVKYSYEIDARDGSILSKSSRNTIAVGKFLPKETPTPKEPTITDTTLPATSEAEIKEKLKEKAAEKDPSSNTAPKTATEDTKVTDNKGTDKKVDNKVIAGTDTAKPKKKVIGNVIPKKKAQDLNAYISLERAKEIALKNSGVSANAAIFETAKLEREDGIDVYDIDFFTSTMEYDYEINAHTGEIVKYSFEPQDKVPSNIIKKKQSQNTINNGYYDDDDDRYDDDDDDDRYDDDRYDDDRYDDDGDD